MFFGLTHLTPNHVAHLQFANPAVPGPEPMGPANVRLSFVDSLGTVLLRGEPQVVMPGETASLDLVADGLEFPAGSNEIGVRGLVTFLNPHARGISSVQIEDATRPSSPVLMDHVARSPYFVRELQPLCTLPIRLEANSLMRINLSNVGDRGFPAAQLVADLVVYAMGPQRTVALKTVQLDLGRSDSLMLDTIGREELFGTVEFTDTASRAVAVASYEYRSGTDGSLQRSAMGSCWGPYGSSSTSGGGGTNSGGA
jgi:hypothetical protein